MMTSAPARAAGSAGHCGTSPGLGSQRGVALEPFDLADQENLDRVAPLSEQPSCYKTIATIVARPGNDDDPATHSKAGTNCIGNGLAGPLHQPDTRHTTGYRSPIGVRHFGIG